MRAFAMKDEQSCPAVTEVPTAQAGPGEVLVNVHASSINGFDLSVTAGYLQGMMEHRFPVVLGKDFAGTIESVGSGVPGFAVGDKVFGVVMKPYLGDGGLGEYVAIPVGYGIARIPEGLSFEQAGVLGLAGTAARQSVDAIAPNSGETVLISGATGGVGAFAVQLAASRGATVIATAKPGDDGDFVRGLGAAHVVDYTGDLAAQVRAIRPGGVEAVIHLAGDGAELAGLLVPGGRFASTLGVGPDQLAGRDVQATSVMASPDTDTLDKLAADVAAGQLQVPIQNTYLLEQAGQAMADFGAGTRGKLALTIA